MISDETRQRWVDKTTAIHKAVESRVITLNDWEEQFFSSVKEALSDGKDLTMNQSFALGRLYRRIG